MIDIVFIGAGEYAESVYDSLDRRLYNLVGFIDENKKGTHIGKPILSDNIENICNFKKYTYFISIGDVKSREKWYRRITKLGLKLINIIDCTAIISKDIKIGVGNFIGKMAVVNVGTVIGDNNMINSKALIEHHCTIKNNTRISTNVVVNGNVVIDNGAYLGSMACCIGQQVIGEFSIIGAGAVVLGDIETYATAVGVPAKIIKRQGIKI
jgi:sugar O-acyltransferase, sialic acid O-acetyltransferase neuD family|nr:MAG TPA: sugar O-acyltransferase, sialic acid O-acetyltransferase NeuD family [Caudoviricetes sp.]